MILIVSLPRVTWATHVIGIDFADGGTRYPGITSTPLNQANFIAYDFLSSASPFDADGALQGWTLGELRQAIVDQTQYLFRTAEINRPGQMLRVDIRLGPVAPDVGINHVVGDALVNPVWFGNAFYDAAHTRPDLNPDPSLPIDLFDGENTLSATAVDTLAQVAITYETADQVVNAISSTIAQEVAHTLGVAFDVPAIELDGVYPVMASGPTGLPVEARLTQRSFLDIPNTQPSPYGSISDPLTYSVPEVLIEKVGLTSISDLNFDGQTDASDLLIWFENRFTYQIVPQRGDANADGLVDANDLLILYGNLFTTHADNGETGNLILDQNHTFDDALYGTEWEIPNPIPEPCIAVLLVAGLFRCTRSSY